jgi:hypothetical protein
MLFDGALSINEWAAIASVISASLLLVAIAAIVCKP